LKILLISIEYPPETGGGGIGSYVASIAPELAIQCHEVHVLSCLEGQKHRDYKEKGVYIHRRGLIRIPGLGRVRRALQLHSTIWRFHTGLSTFLEYRRLDINFDVIEYPDWGAEGWLFAFFHTKPLVAHLHTPLLLIRQHNRSPVNRDVSFASFLEHFSVTRSDLITSASYLLINALNEVGWLRASNIEVLPHAIDWHNWCNADSVKNTEPTVLFLGRLERRKAPELLVEALSIIQKEIPEAKALFVGRGSGQHAGLPYNKWVQKIAKNNKGCQFIGQVPRHELIRLLSKTRVLAMPSWFDSYGLVAAEAMAAGRPVVVSETSGVSELVKSAKAGRVVPPGDAKALAEGLRPFLKDIDYATQVGRRAKSTIREMLDPGKIAKRRVVLYQKAIDLFKKKLSLKTRGFPYAIPKIISNYQIPTSWRNWAVREAVDTPWKHFYIQTSRQLLELITKQPSFSNLSTLSGIRILDVGCTPAVSVLLACLGAEVILLDIDTDELNKGSYYARLLGVQNHVRTVKADAFKIPFKLGSFDIVWNSGFLEHFNNPHHILQEMGRVLRSGMALIALVPNRWTPHSLWIRKGLRRKPGGYYWDSIGHERSYSQGELVGLFRDAGFPVIASSSANLRRTFLDDTLILPRLQRIIIRGFLFRLINLIDMLEYYIPLLNRFGFMVAALAQKPSNKKTRNLQ